MEMSISWLAVVVATAVGMAIAGVWYGWAFVGVWRELTGVTEEDSKRAGKRPFVVLLASILVTALGLAAACSIASGFFGSDSLWLDLAVGLATWLGFSLTEFLGASLAIYGAVSPSGVSAGVARRSGWSGLAVDVVLDDR